MAESKTEIVAYLDDDAEPNEHWLEFLLTPFEDPLVASVTGRSILPGTIISNLSDEPSRTISNRDPQWFEMATFGGMGHGNNMALRRASCTGNSIFDVRLGRGAPIRIAEEHHAFASLLARGYRAVHVPAAIVVHPVRPEDIEQQASNSVAYWLLLFSEFPSHRVDLLRFLFRRLRRKPLTWPREPQAAGKIITSGWRVYWKAVLRGARLFLRAMKSK